jgi:hypothetical protein
MLATFLFLPHYASYCVSITEQTTAKSDLFVKYMLLILCILSKNIKLMHVFELPWLPEVLVSFALRAGIRRKIREPLATKSKGNSNVNYHVSSDIYSSKTRSESSKLLKQQLFCFASFFTY